MSSVDKVIEELYPEYASRKKTKNKPAAAKGPKKEPEVQPMKPTKARPEPSKVKTVRAVRAVKAEKQASLPDPMPPPPKLAKRRRAKDAGSLKSMYTLSVVGSISLGGYPLQPGEKLVLVKLTPIHMAKGAI